MNIRRTFLPVLTAFALAVSAAAANAAEKVVLQLKWLHQFQFAGYYAAKELGYYEEAGFDVEIRQRDPKISPIDAVLAGDADFGVSDSSLIFARMTNRPVVALAAIFQHSPLVLMTRAADGILGPLELKGKRVMFQRNLDDATLTAMFSQFGMTQGDYVHVPQNFKDTALLDGSVDAMSSYITNQPYTYAEKGMPIHIINPINYGIDFYGDMLFASQAAVERDPQRVEAFIKASLKGWRYALKEKAKTVDWIIGKYGATKTREHLLYEADATEKMILPNLVEIGHTNINRFQRIANIYKNEGMVPKDSNFDGIDFKVYLTPSKELPFWLKLFAVGSAVLAVLSGFLLWLNRRLKRMVDERTHELAAQTARLEIVAAEQSALAKQLDYQNEVKNRFFSIIAHDLRSPFTSLIGLTQMMDELSEQLPHAKLVEYAKTVNTSADRIFELLENLLDWARFQMETAEPDRQRLLLSDLVSECVSLLTPAAKQKGITVETVECEQLVYADKSMVLTVLRNLLANAVKFTPTGGEIKIAAKATDKFTHVTVADNGVGIPAGVAKNVFAIDKKTTTQGTSGENGTGLGLPLCREMVERNGGEIWLESEVGSGTKFHFTVRRYVADALEVDTSGGETLPRQAARG